MGASDFSHILFLVRMYVFEVCETFLFIALAVGLTVHTVRLIVEFGRREKK